MDLNALADFALVASSGGLGKASRASGKSKATLSRRIADLEEQLDVRLIERSARGLKLTDAGAALMARTQGPMLEVAEAMTATREGLSAPRGLLRVAESGGHPGETEVRGESLGETPQHRPPIIVRRRASSHRGPASGTALAAGDQVSTERSSDAMIRR